jgi:hypothetical protein
MVRRRKPVGVVLPVDPNDPRSLDHPSQREKWLELARSIGAALADREWDRLNTGDEHEGRTIRSIFERPAKRPLDR